MGASGRLRQLRAVVPVLVLAVLTALLWAHDATWSIVLGLVVVVLAVGAALLAANGRYGEVLGIVAVLVFTAATTSSVSAWWLRGFGADGTATVSEVQHHVRRGTAYDDYAVRLTDGEDVAGPLRSYRTGALHVGDTVRIRYDPTGVIRFPRELDDRRGEHDTVAAPIVATAALLLLVVLALRTPTPSVVDRRRRTPVSVAELRRRLAAERGEAPPPAG